MESCCKHHQLEAGQRRALLARSLVTLASGLLLHVHSLEHLLLSLCTPAGLFTSVSALVVYLLYMDFHHIFTESWSNRLRSFACYACFGLFAYQFSMSVTPLLSIPIYILYLSTVVSIVILPLIAYLAEKFSIINISPRFQPSALLTKALHMVRITDFIPSMDHIVLFSALTTWVASAFVIFHPAVKGAELLLSDTLMTLGVFGFGRWFRSGFQSHRLMHNHMERVQCYPMSGHSTPLMRRLDQLKCNDMLVVDNPYGVTIPTAVIAMNGVRYLDPQSEEVRIVTESEGKQLLSHHVVYSGQVLCLDDYKAPYHLDYKKLKSQHADSKEWGIRLYIFTMYLAAVVSSLSLASTGGLVLGIERLCACLMVACPCVYMVIKPALQGLIPAISRKLGFMMNTTVLPLLYRRKTVIFDRTGTLYHPAVCASSGCHAAYVMTDAARKMIKNLLAMGVDVKILSGHSTKDWKIHLADTRQEFKNLGIDNPEQNIIFSENLHGAESLKGEYLRRVRRYGSFEVPNSWLKRMWCHVESVLFPRTIMMVGDDINDKSAMEIADLAIAVGRKVDSVGICKSCAPDNTCKAVHDSLSKLPMKPSGHFTYHDMIAPYADFVAESRGVEHLDQLVHILDKVSYVARMLTSVSVVVGVFFMLIVSGVIPAMLPISSSLICGFSTSYCIFVSYLVHQPDFHALIGLSGKHDGSSPSILNKLKQFFSNTILAKLFLEQPKLSSAEPVYKAASSINAPSEMSKKHSAVHTNLLETLAQPGCSIS
ncbi:MAG TPA: hypothetical protein DCW33_03915 [Proteobacteria bacterium]|nr:hypothetical protein [Pseudomonadota bacterium]